MSKKIENMIRTILMLFSIALFFYSCNNKDIKDYDVSDQEITIFPDYKNIILPRNIKQKQRIIQFHLILETKK